MRDCIMELLVDVKRDAITKFDETKDVQSAMEAIATVVHMSNVARTEGLLALEEEFVVNPSPQDATVSSMALLVVDGVEPGMIAEVLTNGYWANKYENNDALTQYILMRGTLLVQEGLNPCLIEDLLSSLLPKSLHTMCAEYIETKKAVWKEESDAKVLEQFKNWKPVELENEIIKARVRKIEELVLTLHDYALQRVMRDVDNSDMTTCAAVFSEKGRKFIFKNVSSRLRVMMIRELLYMSEWTALSKEEDVLSAAEKVEKVIRRLEGNGEIVLLEK